MSLYAPPRRTRRLVSAVAVSVLGVGALAAGTSAAHAAPTGTNAVTATVTPTSVIGGSTTEFDLHIAAGDLTGNAASLIKVAVPAGFDNVNVVPGSFHYSAPSFGQPWSQTVESPNTVVFSTPNASHGLVDSDWLDVHVTAHASGAGAQTWTTTAFKGTASSSNAEPVLASPVVTITGGTQVLTFGALDDKTFGDPDFGLGATSTSSANPITYTASGDCHIVSGTQVHLDHAGSCTVTAHQAAGNGYTAATDVAQSFSIAKAAQTITFAAPSDKTYGDGSFDVSATSDSGLAVTFAAGGNCTMTGSTVQLTGAGSCTITASQAGNGDYDAATDVVHTFAINKAGATLDVSDLEQTYDGNAHAITTSTTPDGLTVEVTYSQNGTDVAAPTNAGTYDFTATVVDANYSGSVTGQLTIDRLLVHGAFTAADKAYDGTTDAAITDESLTDAVPGDDVDLTGGSAAFATKDAGTQDVTLTGAGLSGSAADNYTLSDDAITTTATINPRLVTAVLYAGDKEYDGTTDATDVSVHLTDGDVVSPDTVGVAITSASFDGTDVGAHTVTATVHLTDNALGDYTLGAGTSVSHDASIYQRMTSGSFTVDNKVYDRTTTATVHSTALTNVVNHEDVSLVVDPVAFIDRNVGTAKIVNGTFSLTGARAPQYVLAPTFGTTTANISAKDVTASITADNKVWDGTTTAVIHPTLGGVISGDVVNVTGTGTFSSSSVGTWTVTSTNLAISGTDAGNYHLTNTTATATAKITAAYVGTGFYQPVDMNGVFNKIKGGQTVPLKFNEADANGVNQTTLSIFAANAFSVSTVACNTSAPVDAVEMTTTGSTSLRYDTTGGQYIQNWKTPTTVGCYSVKVTTVDGSTIGPAYFQVTK
ncbi:YDG domain-containing protein [Nocardioides ultimimeridianus]